MDPITELWEQIRRDVDPDVVERMSAKIIAIMCEELAAATASTTAKAVAARGLAAGWRTD